MELAAENVLAGREHCFSEIGLLSFENRTLLVEDRENNGREPDDYPQGLSGAQLRADSRTQPFCEFLASTPVIIAPSKFHATWNRTENQADPF